MVDGAMVHKLLPPGGAPIAEAPSARGLRRKVDMLKRGIVVRGVGESIIFCPPLVVTDAEIGQFIETLHEALR